MNLGLSKLQAWEMRKRRKGRAKGLDAFEQRARVAQIRRVVNTLKTNPCVDCDECFPPDAMDFDHVRGKKLLNVSVLVGRGATDLVMKEIEKCDLVCSNCHRIRHSK